MDRAKKVFSANKIFYYITLVLWFASCVCAAIFVFKSDEERLGDITNYVKDTLSQNGSVWVWTKLGILENIKLMIILLISSSAPVLLPVNAFLIAFKGFSLGFTASLLIKIYSIKGLGFCFLSVVVPYTFSLPVLFMMFTTSLALPFKKENSYSYARKKKNEWVLHSYLMVLCTSILCLISFAGAILTYFSIKIFV